MTTWRIFQSTTIFVLAGALWPSALWGAPGVTSALNSVEIEAGHRAVRVPFIENRGQADAGVALYAHTFGGTVAVTRAGEIVYALPEGKAREADTRRTLALKEVLVGRQAGAPRGEGRAVTRVSDFTGGDPSRWQSDLPTWETASLGEVYEGIELGLRARGGSVEKIFRVAPGARPGKIQLRVDGARRLSIDRSGELVVATALGQVRFTRPVAFQDMDGRRVDVPVRYALHGHRTYGFEVGPHDPAHPLVIDPLLASTFVGGGHHDRAYALALERVALGYGPAVFIAGWTTSKRLPGAAVGVVYDAARGGDEDAFVAKLDADLGSILAATFLGGAGVEEAWGLALDATGNVYVAGFTNSPNFPTTRGAASRVYGGGRTDAFVAKLDNDLQTLLASTFLGGGGEDRALALAVGAVVPGDTSVFVTGFTSSRDFPTTTVPCCAQYGGMTGREDVFVTRLGGAHLGLLDSAKIGGIADDRGQAIAVGGVDRGYNTGDPLVVVTGCSENPDRLPGEPTQDAYYPTTHDAFQPLASNGKWYGVVTVLSWDFNRMHGSTFLRATRQSISEGTCGRAVAIDGSNNIFVAGVTRSADFPTTPAAYDREFNDRVVDGDPACAERLTLRRVVEGLGDAFVVRLGPSLYEEASTLIASTYLGGCAADFANALVLREPSDPSSEDTGNVYVAGHTYSTDFPTSVGAYDPIHRGRADAFVAKLDYALGELRASTFLGGRGFDAALGLARDASGNVYVAGYTYSDDFPTTPGAADVELSGHTDAFVSKLDDTLAEVIGD